MRYRLFFVENERAKILQSFKSAHYPLGSCRIPPVNYPKKISVFQLSS